MKKPLTAQDFIDAKLVATVLSNECAFFGTFLEPNIFATAHSTIGVQLWEYPSFRFIRALMHEDGYVATIKRFGGSKYIGVSNDNFEHFRNTNTKITIFNYETGEERASIIAKNLAWTTIDSTTICFMSKDGLSMRRYDAEQNIRAVPFDEDIAEISKVQNDLII